MSEATHHGKKDGGRGGDLSDAALKFLRIINILMYYVILSIPPPLEGQYRGSIIHVEEMCVFAGGQGH